MFQVYDKLHLDRIPQRYTVEAGEALDDEWALTGDDGRYDLWILGPNGFLRTFKGQASSATAGLSLEVRQDKADASLTVTMRNSSRAPAVVRIEDAYRKDEGAVQVALQPGSQRAQTWRLQGNGLWYDLTFTAEGGFERRLAGRLETGKDSVSDPLMGMG
ncbi:Non-hemolytic phospholipase C precursor [compost metagenome]